MRNLSGGLTPPRRTRTLAPSTIRPATGAVVWAVRGVLVLVLVVVAINFLYNRPFSPKSVGIDVCQTASFMADGQGPSGGLVGLVDQKLASGTDTPIDLSIDLPIGTPTGTPTETPIKAWDESCKLLARGPLKALLTDPSRIHLPYYTNAEEVAVDLMQRLEYTNTCLFTISGQLFNADLALQRLVAWVDMLAEEAPPHDEHLRVLLILDRVKSNVDYYGLGESTDLIGLVFNPVLENLCKNKKEYGFWIKRLFQIKEAYTQFHPEPRPETTTNTATVPGLKPVKNPVVGVVHWAMFSVAIDTVSLFSTLKKIVVENVEVSGPGISTGALEHRRHVGVSRLVLENVCKNTLEILFSLLAFRGLKTLSLCMRDPGACAGLKHAVFRSIRNCKLSLCQGYRSAERDVLPDELWGAHTLLSQTNRARIALSILCDWMADLRMEEDMPVLQIDEVETQFLRPSFRPQLTKTFFRHNAVPKVTLKFSEPVAFSLTTILMVIEWSLRCQVETEARWTHVPDPSQNLSSLCSKQKPSLSAFAPGIEELNEHLFRWSTAKYTSHQEETSSLSRIMDWGMALPGAGLARP
ncbi:hypothetical protein NEDG_00034 [Nematocida displodere]|uniref:Transmembrane protein n=1 Tax=Nematocida displodere TaxID=1805483 RepID=A0A177EKP8_9MICR|nr:hypothetical protein NEDG_00034 [Nematocida displodere]